MNNTNYINEYIFNYNNGIIYYNNTILNETNYDYDKPIKNMDDGKLVLITFLTVIMCFIILIFYISYSSFKNLNECMNYTYIINIQNEQNIDNNNELQNEQNIDNNNDEYIEIYV
jgi:hypothetical protein